jgi:hypothetical protein
MTDRKRQDRSQPCEAEQAWFEASDRFYRVLAKDGQAAALKTARAVLKQLPAPAEKAQGNTTRCKT